MQIVKLAFLYLSVLFLFGCDPDSINDHGHCRGGGCQINGGSIYQYGEQKEDPCSNWVAPIECHSPDDRERPPPEDTTGDSGSTSEPIPSDPDELPSYDPEKDNIPAPNYDLGDLSKSWGNFEEGIKNAFGEVTGESARKRREAKQKKALVDQIQATVDKIQAHLEALDDLKPGLGTSVGSSHQWARENGIEQFTTAITGDVNGYNSHMQNVIDGVPTVELDYGQLPNGQAAVYVEQRELVATQGYVEAIREEVYTRYQGHETFHQRVTLVNASEAAIQVADEAYRQGKHQQGDFARKIAIALADAAISFTPGVSWVNDVYSVVTGKSWTGEELDSFDYGMAVLGTVTAGYGSKFKYLKHAGEAFEVVENVMKKAGSMADLEKALSNNKKAREVWDNLTQQFPRKGKWGVDGMGEPGFSTFYPDKEKIRAIIGDEGVPYKGGFPQFDKWVQPGHSKQFDGLVGDYNKDYDQVDKWIMEMYDLRNITEARNWRSANKLTPHHLEDGRTMQLVPTDLHRLSHLGGASLIKQFGTPKPL